MTKALNLGKALSLLESSRDKLGLRLHPNNSGLSKPEGSDEIEPAKPASTKMLKGGSTE